VSSYQLAVSHSNYALNSEVTNKKLTKIFNRRRILLHTKTAHNTISQVYSTLYLFAALCSLLQVHGQVADSKVNSLNC